MPAAAERCVLDTSALLCLIEGEDGADEVEKILRTHGPKGNAYLCFISLMEFYYINHQERGEAVAQERYTLLKELPLKVVESDPELGLAAGRIKAAHRLSVADAWIAAVAERLEAVLVHKDPEFEPLKRILRLAPLPYKT
jgi:predicted nucleic acid-binding protein